MDRPSERIDRLSIPAGASFSGLRPPVVVACSGGADSLALLALSARAGLRPVAVHVDHRARPGSATDAMVVARYANEAGARFAAESVTVGPGPNFEARARHARYAALEGARARLGATVTLVGHTRDDQAETVLLNLLRGAAAAGLAGMPAARGTIARPLLGVSRDEARQVCHRLGWAPLDDPMNADVAHRRVWLRREVLPALEAGADRDLTALLARQAIVARGESDYLDALAAEALAAAGTPPRTEDLASLPPALLRRAIRVWLGPPPPDAAAVEAIVETVHGRRRAVDLAGGGRVVRAGGRLSLVPVHSRHENSEIPEYPCPEPVRLPGKASTMGVTLRAWVERAAPIRWPDGRWTAVCDANAAGGEAVLRPAEPAERFRPLGLEGRKLVFDALADAGVAAEGRAAHPVLATPGGEVIWLVGYRIDHRVRVCPDTRRFLWLAVDRDREGAGGSRA